MPTTGWDSAWGRWQTGRCWTSCWTGRAGGLPEVIATSDGARTVQVGGAGRYLLPDSLDSVRQVADGAGAVAAVQGYAPFGEELGAAASAWGFTGEWQEPSGLLFLRAVLRPGTGRFS